MDQNLNIPQVNSVLFGSQYYKQGLMNYQASSTFLVFQIGYIDLNIKQTQKLEEFWEFYLDIRTIQYSLLILQDKQGHQAKQTVRINNQFLNILCINNSQFKIQLLQRALVFNQQIEKTYIGERTFRTEQTKEQNGFSCSQKIYQVVKQIANLQDQQIYQLNKGTGFTKVVQFFQLVGNFISNVAICEQQFFFEYFEMFFILNHNQYN
ncbi:unnamed protein product [Paramecium octaurelia]|uniref:Uncharacterized protein n=1 Tax=Paramecium octaurelia TaxID=43137 RepID=A0A8S1YEI1_PAROT|nr:unnamed protein product [Paramecium octaurelia]